MHKSQVIPKVIAVHNLMSYSKFCSLQTLWVTSQELFCGLSDAHPTEIRSGGAAASPCVRGPSPVSMRRGAGGGETALFGVSKVGLGR